MNFIAEIFQYQFLAHAALACLLCGIACGIIGTYVVCRRLVFLSGGITHASFGGIGMAYYFGANPLLGALIFAILSAWGIETFTSRKQIREDSAIGLIWSLGMAIGIIFIYLTPGYAPNLMSFLFGNILSVTSTDIIWMAIVDAFILLIFATMYRPILYVAFDREYARSQNFPTRIVSYLMATLVAITIVISIRVVGIVLLISLLTIPAVIGNLISKSFNRILIYGSVIAALSAFAGLYISYKTNIPSGASTIFVLTLTLIAVKTTTFVRNKRSLKSR
jgi:zinc transport system permease protein